MENKRSLSIDLVKIVAMCSVICLHSQFQYAETSSVAHALYVSAVVAIPLFFMTSGYLILGKQGTDYRYASRKVRGIIRFVAIMTVTFWLVIGLRHDVPFITATIGSLFQCGSLGIYWYFGAMMLIYLLLPLLNKLYKEHFKCFLLLTAVLLVCSSLVFCLNYSNGIHIEQHTVQTFRLWNWLLYFNLGGLVRHYHVRGYLPLTILLFIVNYMFQCYTVEYMETPFCEYYYPSMPVMLLSVSLFAWLRGISDANLRFVVGGGKLFLPCYTIHTFIIARSGRLHDGIAILLGIDAASLLFWVLMCVVTMAVSWMVMKVPYMDKVFRI